MAFKKKTKMEKEKKSKAITNEASTKQFTLTCPPFLGWHEDPTCPPFSPTKSLLGKLVSFSSYWFLLLVGRKNKEVYRY
jgi:hypothetical protein